MPMTFLSGVFYSIQSLPPFWQAVSHLNPFFYMIDGFRHGFFGVSDVSPWTSLAVVGGSLAVRLRRCACTCCGSGYKCATERPELPSAPPVAIRRVDRSMADPTPADVERFIAPAWPASTCEVEGDGRHFFATIVSAEFEGTQPRRAPPARLPRRWAIECASKSTPCR